MPQKRRLLTPGPTAVPPEVLAALGEPVLHHRGPDFKSVFARVRGRLREVFRTENEVLILTASGTGAFESAVTNLLSPGERVLAVSWGNFGERWAKMAAAYGCEVETLAYAWGETPQPAELEQRLGETGAETVFLVHSETSTGVVAELEPLVGICREAGALAVVDAISSLGAVPLETDAWDVDVVVTGSQKALMTPPGLAFVSVSERASRKAETATLPRFYWDWRRMIAEQEKDTTAFTPAVSTVVALDVALGRLLDEGLESAFARHTALGRACRAGVKEMGLELYSPDDDRSAVLTAVLTPEGVDAIALRLALRDRHGITIAGGHGDIADRLFRIGHIGYVDVYDIAAVLAAVELELVDAGADVERGVAVSAALEAYQSAARV
jgi:aspartate aminotransferase-like enzyme